jgi:hypothetical protein
MGIYTNGSIFGIYIYTYDYDNNINTLYSKKYDTLMSDKEKKEAYAFYSQLNDKTDIYFRFYTQCSSTLEDINETPYFMTWYPMSLNLFLEKFAI